MIRRSAVAAGVAIIALLGATTPASAAVPYSWWCYKGSQSRHVYSANTVGQLVAYWGYQCYGGYWRDV